VEGLLQALGHIRYERTAAGELVTIEECNLLSFEIEVLQAYESADGADSAWMFLELSDGDGDGFADHGIFTQSETIDGVTSGAFILDLADTRADLEARQACAALAVALDICG
jgi:hypothetical protein